MLSHVSATSITLFQSCPRRWYERYVLGKKGESTKAMLRGNMVHRKLEDYLTKGEAPDIDNTSEGLIARSGLMHLPLPSPDHKVEISIEDMPYEGTPAPFKGYIDLYVSGEDAEDGHPEVLDHKTTSNISKYALTAEQLKDNTQMIIYAAHILNHEPTATKARLTHVAYSTKTPYQAQHTSTLIDREEVLTKFQAICEIVQEMVDASELPANALEKKNDYCWSYGKRCPYYNECQRTMNHAGVKNMSDKQLSVIDRLRGTPEKKVSDKAKPQSEPQPQESKSAGGAWLYVDCFPLDEKLTPLSEGIAPLIKTVCVNKGVDHIELVPYMGGYSLLSSLIMDKGLPEGHYYINSSSTLYVKCLDALYFQASRVTIGR